MSLKLVHEPCARRMSSRTGVGRRNSLKLHSDVSEVELKLDKPPERLNLAGELQVAERSSHKYNDFPPLL